MKIYDRGGYTPLQYAAYKNLEQGVETLIKFVLSEPSEESVAASSHDAQINGGSGESGDKKAYLRMIEQKKKVKE